MNRYSKKRVERLEALLREAVELDRQREEEMRRLRMLAVTCEQNAGNWYMQCLAATEKLERLILKRRKPATAKRGVTNARKRTATRRA